MVAAVLISGRFSSADHQLITRPSTTTINHTYCENKENKLMRSFCLLHLSHNCMYETFQSLLYSSCSAQDIKIQNMLCWSKLEKSVLSSVSSLLSFQFLFSITSDITSLKNTATKCFVRMSRTGYDS